MHFIKKWLIADQEEKFKLIYRYFSRKIFIEWFGNELKTYSSPNQLGALKMLIYFINTTADLNDLLVVICKSKNGPQFSDSEVIRAISRTWLCLQREKFSFLDVFAKVSGHPEVIERQFGTVMMDVMLTGREIKTYIPLTEVVKNLEAFLTNTTIDIESMLKQEFTKIEDQLLAFHKQIRPALESKEASTEDKMYLADEDAYLYYDGSTIVLTDKQEFTLKAIAYSIKKILDQDGEGGLMQYLSLPIQKLKLIVAAFVNEKYNMILTEQAWEWIEEIDDTFYVKILLVKLIIDDTNNLNHVKSHSDIRKAMFENEMITLRIAQYMGDGVIMDGFR